MRFPFLSEKRYNTKKMAWAKPSVLNTKIREGETMVKSKKNTGSSN